MNGLSRNTFARDRGLSRDRQTASPVPADMPFKEE